MVADCAVGCGGMLSIHRVAVVSRKSLCTHHTHGLDANRWLLNKTINRIIIFNKVGGGRSRILLLLTSLARFMTGAQNVEYDSPPFINARASAPMCAPVARHSDRLYDIPVVIGYLKLTDTSEV